MWTRDAPFRRSHHRRRSPACCPGHRRRRRPRPPSLECLQNAPTSIESISQTKHRECPFTRSTSVPSPSISDPDCSSLRSVWQSAMPIEPATIASYGVKAHTQVEDAVWVWERRGTVAVRVRVVLIRDACKWHARLAVAQPMWKLVATFLLFSIWESERVIIEQMDTVVVVVVVPRVHRSCWVFQKV